MQRKTIVCSLAIASLGFSSPSFAQPSVHEARQDAREARQDLREAQRDLSAARSDERQARHYYNARTPEFRRGGRLPPELRHNQYVISDWRHHHLSAPPRGYHWVQVGPDYVLAAIATGLIANLIIGS